MNYIQLYIFNFVILGCEFSAQEINHIKKDNISYYRREEEKCQLGSYRKEIKLPGCISQEITMKRCGGNCQKNFAHRLGNCVKCQPAIKCYYHVQINCVYGKTQKVRVVRHKNCACIPTPCKKNMLKEESNPIFEIRLTAAKSKKKMKCFREWY